VKDINTVASVGDELEATILEVDRKKKQVHLSRKALEAKPQSKAKEEEPEPEEPEVKTITAMEAAFLKAQSGGSGTSDPGSPANARGQTAKKRQQQEDILSRTLQTAPRK
jgi:predicted RNA-binding protein with RPS1 domain